MLKYNILFIDFYLFKYFLFVKIKKKKINFYNYFCLYINYSDFVSYKIYLNKLTRYNLY